MHGLFYYENEKLNKYRLIPEIENQEILSIKIEKNGTLWLGTNDGLRKINLTNSLLPDFS